MKRIIKALSSPLLMAFLLVLLIVTLAAATFIENDFGTQSARLKVYNALWFEILLLLIAINLLCRIVYLKLYRINKMPVFLFHFAFIVMLSGSALTRYYGIEGNMHIREGQSSKTITTYQKQISIRAYSQTDSLHYTFASNIENRQPFSETFTFDGKQYSIKLNRFYQHALPVPAKTTNGKAIVGFFLSGKNYQGKKLIQNNEIITINDISIALNHNQKADINLSTLYDSLYIQSNNTISVSTMQNDSTHLLSNQKHVIEPRKIYHISGYSFVVYDFIPSGEIIPQTQIADNMSQGMQAMVFSISGSDQNTQLTLWENQWNKQSANAKINNMNIEVAYGNHTIKVPFALHLDDFVIERYPGSMSPSSFSSYVQIIEPNKPPKAYHIYMNNILKLNGYRFFQSSYDDDEKGTILSVNYDPWGTRITYLSYILLVLGIVLSMLNPKSFFRKTEIHGKIFFALLCFSVFVPSTVFANQSQHISVDKQHAQKFSKLLIQNNRGRTEPVNSFAWDIVRKISRRENVLGLTPSQLFLEMNLNPEYWATQPIIRVKNDEIQKILGINTSYAAYTDFVLPNGAYTLRTSVQNAYAKAPAQRNKFDKAIIKTDEKVNICYAVFNGDYLRIIPDKNSDNMRWHTAAQIKKINTQINDSTNAHTQINRYFDLLIEAKNTGDYSGANTILNSIKQYQRDNAGYTLPSPEKISIEVFYNKINPFKKLFPFYFLFGIIHLFILISFISSGKKTPQIINKIFLAIVVVGFITHSAGIGSRWYISGYVPLSNGYETMVFISWITILAGFIFSKRSNFVLSATVTLGGLTLMVANLSFMDPVITNLVPVLQSYWLTIHVSVITASYGFLALGAILGTINLVLILLHTKNNHIQISETISELTIINQKSLILGLYMLTIGAFLGAVWANESWGRYWGWDPKETWSLISIIVYTLVTHARLIPGAKGVFTYNVLSVWAFSSILMTYFGVNYYLSGLHSYVGGDPVPIPNFVYVTVSAFVILSVWAEVKYRKIVKLQAGDPT